MPCEPANTGGASLQEAASPYQVALAPADIAGMIRRHRPAMNALTDGQRQQLLAEALEVIREGNLKAKNALRG